MKETNFEGVTLEFVGNKLKQLMDFDINQAIKKETVFEKSAILEAARRMVGVHIRAVIEGRSDQGFEIRHPKNLIVVKVFKVDEMYNMTVRQGEEAISRT